MCLPDLQKAYYTCFECAGQILNLVEHGIGVFNLYSFISSILKEYVPYETALILLTS